MRAELCRSVVEPEITEENEPNELIFNSAHLGQQSAKANCKGEKAGTRPGAGPVAAGPRTRR